MIEHLYVQPAHQRRGVGAALLARARAVSPGGLSLWCFVRNRPARAFYAREGFIEVEETDGSGNEEREPDLAHRLRDGLLVETAAPAEAAERRLELVGQGVEHGPTVYAARFRS